MGLIQRPYARRCRVSLAVDKQSDRRNQSSSRSFLRELAFLCAGLLQ
jgi:hypothetical protein